LSRRPTAFLSNRNSLNILIILVPRPSPECWHDLNIDEVVTWNGSFQIQHIKVSEGFPLLGMNFQSMKASTVCRGLKPFDLSAPNSMVNQFTQTRKGLIW